MAVLIEAKNMRSILFFAILLTSFSGIANGLDPYALQKQMAEEYLAKGISAYRKKNYADAARFYKKSIGYAKSVRASGNLCNLYLYGQGIEKDVAKAKALCEYSARYDDAHALVMLGEIYLFGNGAKKDRTKALNYYQRAAKLGHVHGTFMLANLLQKIPPG